MPMSVKIVEVFVKVVLKCYINKDPPTRRVFLFVVDDKFVVCYNRNKLGKQGIDQFSKVL